MGNTFLSCDWGTSSFRLRLIDKNGLSCVAAVNVNEGIANVFAKYQQEKTPPTRINFYKKILSRSITQLELELQCGLAGVPLVISGMASSSIGMKELPYKNLPFSILDADLYYEVFDASKDFPHELLLVSGIKTNNDVIRGEETQLLGCSILPMPLQVFIFPGTHSKHIFVNQGLAVNFKTFMTGEFFHLLSQKSILQNSLAAGEDLDGAEKILAFDKGILDGRDQNILHASFRVRTQDLFKHFTKEQNYWYLSGLLIATELKDLIAQPIHDITLVSSGKLSEIYGRTLACLDAGKHYNLIDGDEALTKAHYKLLLTALSK